MVSGIEGDKTTRAAQWWDVPKPQASAHLPQGRQKEMLCPGYSQLFYSSLPEAALGQGNAWPPADPLSGGAGLTPCLAHSAPALWGPSVMPWLRFMLH